MSGFVNRFLKSFLNFFSVEVLTSPLLTLLLYHICNQKSRCDVAQILGKKFVQNFFAKTIDKLRRMWYNGKFGASRAWAPRPNVSKGRHLAALLLNSAIGVFDKLVHRFHCTPYNAPTPTAPYFDEVGIGDIVCADESNLCGRAAIRTLNHFPFPPISANALPFLLPLG